MCDRPSSHNANLNASQIKLCMCLARSGCGGASPQAQASEKLHRAALFLVLRRQQHRLERPASTQQQLPGEARADCRCGQPGHLQPCSHQVCISMCIFMAFAASFHKHPSLYKDADATGACVHHDKPPSTLFANLFKSKERRAGGACERAAGGVFCWCLPRKILSQTSFDSWLCALPPVAVQCLSSLSHIITIGTVIINMSSTQSA